MRSRILALAAAGALLCGCAAPGRRTAIGAAGGAAGGAAVGAALGAVAGDAGKGAWIGALAGAAIGAGVGNYLDKQARELERIAETRRTENGIVTTLKEKLLFDTNSASLKPAAASSLDQIGDIIRRYPEDRVVVAGHTDNRGSEAYNETLSQRRAEAVRRHLIARGVSSSSLEALGYGKSQPVAPNATDAGRAKNRRVELQISVDESKFRQ